MVMFSCWASRIKFHLSVSASKVGNPAKGNWKFLNSSSCFNTAAIEISVIGKITRIPRREHSALTVERNDRKSSVGDGYVKLSLQYLEAPASVLLVSSATTTGTPLLPRERVAAKALRVSPSRIRTFSAPFQFCGAFSRWSALPISFWLEATTVFSKELR